LSYTHYNAREACLRESRALDAHRIGANRQQGRCECALRPGRNRALQNIRVLIRDAHLSVSDYGAARILYGPRDGPRGPALPERLSRKDESDQTENNYPD